MLNNPNTIYIVHQTAKTRRTSANVQNYLKTEYKNVFCFGMEVTRDTTE